MVKNEMSHLRGLKASEVMNTHVITARPDDALSAIASLMERYKIGSVVIVQNRKVVGILTERDYARIAIKGVVGGRDRARDHMTKPVFTVRSEGCEASPCALPKKCSGFWEEC